MPSCHRARAPPMTWSWTATFLWRRHRSSRVADSCGVGRIAARVIVDDNDRGRPNNAGAEFADMDLASSTLPRHTASLRYMFLR